MFFSGNKKGVIVSRLSIFVISMRCTINVYD